MAQIVDTSIRIADRRTRAPRPPLPDAQAILEAARRIASGRVWQALPVLLDLLAGRDGIDAAELAELRR